MAEYGKWEHYEGRYRRTVKSSPFGFQRLTYEVRDYPSGYLDIPRFLRAVNGEPEPVMHLSYRGPLGAYIFSTEDMEKEVARRKVEPDTWAWGTGVTSSWISIDHINTTKRKPKKPVKRKR